MSNYKELTISEIIEKIQSYPPETFFLIPENVYPHASSFVQHEAAIKRLAYYNDYWDSRGDTPVFYVWRETNKSPVWIKEKLIYEERKLINIGMSNKAITEHAANMMTPLD